MLASRSHPSSFNADLDEPSFADHPDPSVCDGEVTSASLLHGQREVLIRHGSEVYRLRHTRNDKLILTK
ncbi:MULTISPECIES: hemin uptake protein HemP [unclassified Luteimonas]